MDQVHSMRWSSYSQEPEHSRSGQKKGPGHSMPGSGRGLGTSHRLSGMELGTSCMSDKELGISHRLSGMELGISHTSGQELHISRRFESGMALGISHRLESGMELGISQRYIWYSVELPILNLSHKMRGTVAASAGHTSSCGFAKSEKKGLIRTKKVSRETPSISYE